MSFSLRELYWRADALENSAWNKVAWLLTFTPRWSKRTLTFNDFHPLRVNMRALTPEELSEERNKYKGYLPAKLTEAEKEARWESWCRRRDAENGRK